MTDTTAITPAQVAEILIGGERDRREVPQISESHGDLDQSPRPMRPSSSSCSPSWTPETAWSATSSA